MEKKYFMYRIILTSVLLCMASAQGMNRLARLFTCCCCVSEPTTLAELDARINLTRITILHRCLTRIQRERPRTLRALYLKCKDNRYSFSTEDKDYLENATFLIDKDGILRKGDITIILDLLSPNETFLDENDWYFKQKILDLALRFPILHEKLRRMGLRSITLSEPLSIEELTVLYGTYNIIANASTITTEELTRILIVTTDDSEATALLPFTIKPAEMYGRKLGPEIKR